MLNLPDKESSLLKPEGFLPSYPTVKDDIQVDTAIVGGGIAGLSAAYLLTKSGQKVAVLDKASIGHGTTGHNTGKVTSQHNIVYDDMVKRHGEHVARLYGHANNRAIDEIEKIIKKEEIDCGWQRAGNYVYTADKNRLSKFKSEAEVAKKLGLPASFETKTDLPFKIIGAVKFSNQAHFNAQKYVEGLASAISRGGSHVFEQSRVTTFSDGSIAYVESNGYKVWANNIIVATNVPALPLLARTSYCLLEYPHTSYLIAGKNKVKLSGMYISPDKDHYSLLPVGQGKDQILLVGGENHIPGFGRARPRQNKLADYGERHFGLTEVNYRWHARDYMAYDGLPLVGGLYPWSKRMYVVTAFKKWGLSQSYVTASLLRDLILDEPNALADFYSPHRFSLKH